MREFDLRQGQGQAGWQFAPEVLEDRHARAHILDQNGPGGVLGRKSRNFTSKVGILQTLPEYVDQVPAMFALRPLITR